MGNLLQWGIGWKRGHQENMNRTDVPTQPCQQKMIAPVTRGSVPANVCVWKHTLKSHSAAHSLWGGVCDTSLPPSTVKLKPVICCSLKPESINNYKKKLPIHSFV